MNKEIQAKVAGALVFFYPHNFRCERKYRPKLANTYWQKLVKLWDKMADCFKRKRCGKFCSISEWGSLLPAADWQSGKEEIRKYIFWLKTLSVVPNCPLLPMVPNCPGAKLSAVPNCPRCQIVRGAKLSTFTHGAKLSANMGGAKLSAVPNCPGAKLS